MCRGGVRSVRGARAVQRARQGGESTARSTNVRGPARTQGRGVHSPATPHATINRLPTKGFI